MSVEVTGDKNKYTLMSCRQNVGRNKNKKVADKYYERLVEFKYWWTNVTNQNWMKKEITRKLNMGNACW
jgi:hypothetical protein